MAGDVLASLSTTLWNVSSKSWFGAAVMAARQGLRRRSTSASHTMHQGDAWRHAMVRQIARFGVGGLGEAGQRAVMQNLGRTMPPDCWPKLEPAHGGFRKRA